jgi:hypothetical protein
MASLKEMISAQVSSLGTNANIPAGLKDKVLGGLSDSVLGSLTQTVGKPGGVEQIKALVTGKVKPADSPVTALAGNIFDNDILKKLNLGAAGDKLKGLVPLAMGKLSGIIKDQDGDGDIDLDDLILTLKGGGDGILGVAKGILGSFFNRK